MPLLCYYPLFYNVLGKNPITCTNIEHTGAILRNTSFFGYLRIVSFHDRDLPISNVRYSCFPLPDYMYYCLSSHLIKVWLYFANFVIHSTDTHRRTIL